MKFYKEILVFLGFSFYVIVVLMVKPELPQMADSSNVLDVNRWLGVLEGFIMAPTWKGIAIIIGIVAIAILAIANYFYKENLRREEAYKENLRIRKIEEDNLSRMQKDVASSLIDCLDIAYKQDYLYYIERITEKDYSSIYPKISPIYHEKIALFLYDETITANERSSRIISLVRKS